MNIHEVFNKFKGVGDKEPQELIFDEEGNIERYPVFRKIFLTLVIVMVSILSFGLGKLSNLDARNPIKIEYDPELLVTYVEPSTQTKSSPSSNPSTTNSSGGVIASKNGTKYHYAHCSGAKTIKEENKLFFASAIIAEQAGYTLATNCKPR